MRLINADEVKKALMGWETDPTDEEIEYVIDNLPTVVESVRHGKWIVNKWGALVCSECNWCAPTIETGSLVSRRKEYDKSKYCWNCGAKMDGEENETNRCRRLLSKDETKRNI